MSARAARPLLVLLAVLLSACTLDLDVRYQVQARRLVGNHSVIASNLVLGDRVRDSRAPNFAVRLAVSPTRRPVSTTVFSKVIGAF